MNTTVTVALAVGALVVLVAAVALRLADRLGLPSLLLYLALGVALGEGGLGVAVRGLLADPDPRRRRAGGHPRRGRSDHPVGRRPPGDRAGPRAGHGRRRGQRRRSPPPSPSWLLGFGWGFALLLGAVISSTDAAAVFATLRRLPLPAAAWPPRSRRRAGSTTPR